MMMVVQQLLISHWTKHFIPYIITVSKIVFPNSTDEGIEAKRA
jgi:hypothetical protein